MWIIKLFSNFSPVFVRDKFPRKYVVLLTWQYVFAWIVFKELTNSDLILIAVFNCVHINECKIIYFFHSLDISFMHYVVNIPLTLPGPASKIFNFCLCLTNYKVITYKRPQFFFVLKGYNATLKIRLLILGNLGTRFHITKYPTLKYVRNGILAKREYRGQRSAEAFLKFVQVLKQQFQL
jgi:hypothetical protein